MDTPAALPLPLLATVAILAAWCSPSNAAEPAGNDSASRVGAAALFGKARVISEEKLDSMRGGFETPAGLVVSFGIERAVYVNGELTNVVSTSVPDLARAMADNGAMASKLGEAVSIVQNGTGNFANLGPASSSAYALVIQNSLDGQNLQVVTTVDATVNSYQMMRSELLQQRIADAMSTSSLR
ncbi:MAG TPA: hypothetical protein VLC92_15465 [Rhodocyclaceae bacterium]|nr:hypothetical protein [Rhodocyclaceae bacterium]